MKITGYRDLDPDMVKLRRDPHTCLREIKKQFA